MKHQKISLWTADDYLQRQRQKAQERALAPRIHFTATHRDVVSEAVQGAAMTPEQAAIVALLDRVQALELAVNK